MSEVYGNAVVNIAASKAEDGSAGLFSYTHNSRLVRNFVRTSTSEIYEICDIGFYERCIEKAPLSRRAWAFQERYLAQRTLFFSAEQIFCECRHHVASEAWPEGLDVNTISGTDPKFPSRRYLSTKDMPPPMEWEHTFSRYSRAQLTYSKDKLVALSGVARKYQSITKDQYVAGLWRMSLETQLCWISEEDQHHTLSKASFPYRAPSWSWACIDHPVTWSLTLHTYFKWFKKTMAILITIKEIFWLPDGPDALGQLKDGMLKVECGPMIPMIFSGQEVISPVTGPPVPWFCRAHAFIDEHNKSEIDTEVVYFLPILEKDYSDPNFTLHGLLLEPCKRGTGYFTRLGFCQFELLHIQYGMRYQSLIEELLSHPDFLMDESLYGSTLESKEGIPRYSITLV